MFPIPWNFPFRKKNGDLSTIGDVIGSGGGGSDLPPHSASDAGKLLGVKLDGSLEWSDEVNSEIQTLTNYANTQSNPNLLDNPWFTVNQRGFTSTTDLSSYIMDRWKIAYNPNGKTLSLTDGIFTLDNSSSSSTLIVTQIFENNDLAGHDVTASVKLSNDTIVSNSAKLPSPGDSRVNIITSDDFNIYATFDTNSRLGLYIEVKANKSVAIKAVKLELGEVSTLASDIAPNYTTELMKCQRYYVRFKNTDNGVPLAFGYLFQGNSRVTCPLSVPMRAKPSFNFITSAAGGPTFVLASGDVATNISDFTIDTDDIHQRIIFLYSNVTSGTSELAMLRLNTGAILELSADL